MRSGKSYDIDKPFAQMSLIEKAIFHIEIIPATPVTDDEYEHITDIGSRFEELGADENRQALNVSELKVLSKANGLKASNVNKEPMIEAIKNKWKHEEGARRNAFWIYSVMTEIEINAVITMLLPFMRFN